MSYRVEATSWLFWNLCAAPAYSLEELATASGLQLAHDTRLAAELTASLLEGTRNTKSAYPQCRVVAVVTHAGPTALGLRNGA